MLATLLAGLVVLQRTRPFGHFGPSSPACHQIWNVPGRKPLPPHPLTCITLLIHLEIQRQQHIATCFYPPNLHQSLSLARVLDDCHGPDGTQSLSGPMRVRSPQPVAYCWLLTPGWSGSIEGYPRQGPTMLPSLSPELPTMLGAENSPHRRGAAVAKTET